MKKTKTILAALLLSVSMFLPQEANAQAPEKMSYQTIVRDASNNLVASIAVGMRISILQATADGTAVYVETHAPTTNANGLVSIEIGTGTPVTGTFAAINWANGPYFVKTEIDPAGGTTYTITGTSQLLSVPYALHAKTADNGVAPGTATGQMLYWNGTAWVVVVAGTNDQVLTYVNGVPTWKTTLGPNDVFSTTGKVWMDRNLGATQVATSSTDAASYGDLYQWGRGTDGHQIRTSGTTATLSTTDNPGHGSFITNISAPYDWRSNQNDNLWQGVNGVNNPCPSGYRLPTETELDAERASWSSNNAAGAFASPLKLPMAGYRDLGDGSLNAFGFYWSSTVSGTSSRSLAFGSGSAYMDTNGRGLGDSVRCLKD